MRPLVTFAIIFTLAMSLFSCGGCAPSKPSQPLTLKQRAKLKIEAELLRGAARHLDRKRTSVNISTPTLDVKVNAETVPVAPCCEATTRKVPSQVSKLKLAPIHRGVSARVSTAMLPIYEAAYQTNKVGAALLPKKDRVSNYGPSCVYASLQNSLLVCGDVNKAMAMRKQFSGPAGTSDIINACESIGVPYALGGEEVLDFASRTGRACAIFFKGNHSCAFMGYAADGRAVVLDPNSKDRYEYYPREQFLASWRGYGSVAAVVLETPIPGRTI